jgi:tight adherence protein B
MPLVAILIFVGVFAVAAPLLVVWTGSGKANKKQQVTAALDSAIGLAPLKKGVSAANFRKSEQVSSIPFLNRWLQKLDIVSKLSSLLAQADLKWTPGAVILMTLTFFIVPAYLIFLRSGSLIFGSVIGLVLGLGPTGWVMFKRSRRFGKFEQGLPEALDLMVSALRVGHSLTAAMGLVSRESPDPVGTEFRIAFDEQNFGLDFRSSLMNLIARVPLQNLKVAVSAILIQRESGGNLAEVLDKTAHVVRERFRLKRQVMTHTAQGRLTGLILSILPIGLGIGLYIVNPTTMSLLWKRDIGVKLLIGAACSQIIGAVLIHKIVKLDV